MYESLGVKLIYVSFFTSLARGIEIILKPVIAHFSDNLESRFGRRKPFIMIGTIFYIGFLLSVFNPPFLTQTAEYLSFWFGIFYVLFFIAETIVNVPYLALGPELTKKTHEREKLYVFYYSFQYFGVLITAAAPLILAYFYDEECDCSNCYFKIIISYIQECIKKCDLFCNMVKNLFSLKILSYIISFQFAISVGLLFLFIKEKDNTNITTYKAGIIPKLYQLTKNKPFKMLFIPWVIDLTVVSTFSTMLPFYLNVIINPQKYCSDNGISLNSNYCNTQIWLAMCITVFFICCIIFMAGWTWLVKSLGKKNCWKLCSLISIFTFSTFYFAGVGDMEKVILFSFLCSIPAGGSYLNDVFMTDIIDYDEYLTGSRNEGLFTVFISFVPKFVSLFSQSLPLSLLSSKFI